MPLAPEGVRWARWMVALSVAIILGFVAGNLWRAPAGSTGAVRGTVVVESELAADFGGSARSRTETSPADEGDRDGTGELTLFRESSHDLLGSESGPDPESALEALKGQGEHVEGLRHGWWEFHHLSGSLRKAGEYSHGLQTGEWIRWYEDGGVRAEEFFENGLREGECRLWWPGGEPIAVLRFENGRRADGTVLWWHANGKKWREETTHAGDRHGTWREWDEHGGLAVEYEYDRGRRTGTGREWWPSGAQKRVIDFEADGLRGVVIAEWDERGAPVTPSVSSGVAH